MGKYDKKVLLIQSTLAWFVIALLGRAKTSIARMHGGQLIYHQIQEATSRVPIPLDGLMVFPRWEVLLIVKGMFRG